MASEDRNRNSEVRDRKSDMEKKQIKSAKDLRVYKKAYALAMEVFHISKQWPSEERFSLTDQIRRSSRSVCANLREVWLPAPLLARGAYRPEGRDICSTFTR